MPQAYGNGGFTFSFPSTDGVHYLAKPQGTPLGGAISITYSIDASPGAVFDYRTAADNTCGPGFPGTVTAYLHVAKRQRVAERVRPVVWRWLYAQELKSPAAS